MVDDRRAREVNGEKGSEVGGESSGMVNMVEMGGIKRMEQWNDPMENLSFSIRQGL